MPDITGNKKEILPTFIVVGSPKCGSTSLYAALSRHPEIFMSDPKEPRFFSEGIYQKEKSWDWYKSLFQSVQNEKAIGEATVGYTVDYPRFWADPVKIHQALPHLKILYIVRHPLERILSHYVNSKIIGYPRDMGSFENAVKTHPMLIETTKYWKHICPYISRFGKQNVKILFFEDMKSDYTKFYEELFSFLEVNPKFALQKLSHSNRTEAKKMDSEIVRNLRSKINFKFFKKYLPAGMYGFARDVLKNDYRKPSWSNELKLHVYNELKLDCEMLLNYVGKPVDFWKF